MEKKKSRLKLNVAKAIVLFAAMALLFSGCGKENKETANTADKPVELTWYFMNNPQADQDEVFKKANSIISEKLPEVKVNFRPLDPGSYDQRMNVMIASRENFDICFTSSWTNNYHNNVVKGAFVPLDDLLVQYAPKLKESIPDKIWDGTRVGGKIYGVVNYQISSSASAYWVKKDLVDKYNFDISSVKNWYDIESFLQTVKENEPDIIPMVTTQMWIPAANNMGLYSLDVPYNVFRETDSTLTIENALETPEYKQYLKKVREWYQKGYVRSDVMNVTDNEADLRAGKFAVGTEGTIKPGMEMERKAKYGYDCVIIPLSESILTTGSIVATLNAISSTSKNPEKAMQFLELVNTDKELYNLLSFGVEGKHYQKVSDTHIKVVENTKYSASNWMLGSPFNSYLLEGQADDTWEATKKMNMDAKPSPLLGFSFDMDPVKSKIAQIDSVVSEMSKALETGAVDPDQYLPQFIEKMKLAGADDVRAEIQKQINEWKATQ